MDITGEWDGCRYRIVPLAPHHIMSWWKSEEICESKFQPSPLQLFLKGNEILEYGGDCRLLWTVKELRDGIWGRRISEEVEKVGVVG